MYRSKDRCREVRCRPRPRSPTRSARARSSPACPEGRYVLYKIPSPMRYALPCGRSMGDWGGRQIERYCEGCSEGWCSEGAARHALDGWRTSICRGKAEESKVAAAPAVKQTLQERRSVGAAADSSYFIPQLVASLVFASFRMLQSSALIVQLSLIAERPFDQCD